MKAIVLGSVFIATWLVIFFSMQGCGACSRGKAIATGHDKVCVDNVLYLQFASGVSVKYNEDGQIAKCEK